MIRINDHSTYYYVKEQKRSKRKRLKRLIFFLFFITILYPVAQSAWNNLQKQDRAVAGAASTQLINPTPYEKQKDSKLKQIVADALEGTKGSYGVVLLNLKTGEYFLQNENRIFKSASLYKLWVMATAFEQIKNGKLDEKDTISGNLDTINARLQIGSSSANLNSDDTDKQQQTNSNYLSSTVENAMEKMITLSDNYSAIMLTDKIGITNIQFFLDKYGFIDSKLGTPTGDPVTSPYDIALFLKKIYDGELIDRTYSEKMLTLLKWQKLNNKIPKYLPDGVLIAHKTGELDGVTHDAGIVFTPQGDYVIVVLTESDPASRVLAEERISNLSEKVYTYFTTEH